MSCHYYRLDHAMSPSAVILLCILAPITSRLVSEKMLTDSFPNIQMVQWSWGAPFLTNKGNLYEKQCKTWKMGRSDPVQSESGTCLILHPPEAGRSHFVSYDLLPYLSFMWEPLQALNPDGGSWDVSQKSVASSFWCTPAVKGYQEVYRSIL